MREKLVIHEPGNTDSPNMYRVDVSEELTDWRHHFWVGLVGLGLAVLFCLYICLPHWIIIIIFFLNKTPSNDI